MAIKINQLELENVKRIKSFAMHPSENGLTIIGGDNGQGKTSVLDAIAWALGGESYRPSKAQRDGSVTPPMLKIRMNNGLIVERKGKNSSLTVTDPSGQKAGQTLLNEFIEGLALNLPKFMEASGKEKANTLLRIIGVGTQLAELEQKEKELYQERLYVGRTGDQKKKFAKEQPFYPGMPQEPVSASDLIKQQQEILARNGRNQELRLHASELERKVEELEKQVSEAYGKAAEWGRTAIKTIKKAARTVESFVGGAIKGIKGENLGVTNDPNDAARKAGHKIGAGARSVYNKVTGRKTGDASSGDKSKKENTLSTVKKHKPAPSYRKKETRAGANSDDTRRRNTYLQR